MEKICAACGDSFEPLNSDEDANQAARDRTKARQGFDPGDVGGWAVICDDCFQEMERRGILDLPCPMEETNLHARGEPGTISVIFRRNGGGMVEEV